MSMRPVFDPRGGPDTLVTKLIGKAYDTVKRVADHLPEIERLDAVLDQIPELAQISVDNALAVAMPPIIAEVKGYADESKGWATQSKTSADAAAQSALDAAKVSLMFPFTYVSSQLVYDVTVIAGRTDVTTAGLALWVEGAIEYDFTILSGTTFTLNQPSAYPDNAQMRIIVNARFDDLIQNFADLQDSFEQTFQEFLDKSGFEVPVAYTAGISIIRPTQTVSYLGRDYRVKLAYIPLITTTWASDSPKMILVGEGTLRKELSDPTGSKQIGWVRTPLASAIAGTLDIKQSSTQVDIWEFTSVITNKPDPNDFSTWDWTPAFEAARLVLGSLGGGDLVFGHGGVYQAMEIRLDRFIVLNGRGVQGCELKQIAGANRDFIKSENFDVLKGSGLNVNDPRVPSWMGLKDIRVNGNRKTTANPTGNTVGVPVQLYGPAMIMAGTVLIYDGAGGGLYTEDTTNSTSVSWVGQEEGKFGNIIVRACGGFAGWHCRGPHNNDANSIIVGFNDGWNFYSEESALYGGSFDRIGMLHSYAGGRATDPAQDTGVYIGAIARIDNLVVDGDNAIIQSNEVQIGKCRAYNIGGLRDGVVINGNNCGINDFNGIVWSSSVGRTGLIINGNDARINGTLTSNNGDNDGLWIKGTGHIIQMTVKNFTGAGRTGIRLEGTDVDLRGKVRNCATAFNYISGTDNQVNLNIATSAGQIPVAGLAPRSSDRINITSRGTVVGKCKMNAQSAQLAMDISTYTIVTFTHGLLYTPPLSAVRINWLTTSPDSSVWDEALLRVVSTTSTEVVVGYKLASAAPAGTLARIGMTIDLT